MICRYIILGILLLFVCAGVSAIQGQLLLYAIGDNLVINGNNAPITTVTISNINSTYQSQLQAQYNEKASTGVLWLFTDNGVYTYNFTTQGVFYNITIPSNAIEDMHQKVYSYTLQFPDPASHFDIMYDSINKKLYSNIVGIKNISINGLIGDVAYNKFISMRENTAISDIYIDGQMNVGNPYFKINNMYTTNTGDLYLSGNTNLANGDNITGIINYPKSVTLPYYSDMVRNCTVKGENITNYRTWAFTFPQSLSGKLPIGQNEITIRDYLTDSLTTVSFEVRETKPVPTPTPTWVQAYSITGELIDPSINTTNPNINTTPLVDNTTENITNSSTNTTVKKIEINNRSIQQMDVVYVGETNLDMSRAIGWPDTGNGLYYLTYCGGQSTFTTTIDNPRRYYIDPSIYGSRLGEWCQLDRNTEDKEAIVAFVVKNMPVLQSNTTVQNITGYNNTSSNVSVNYTESINTTTSQTNVNVTIINGSIYHPNVTNEISTPVTYTMVQTIETNTNGYPNGSIVVPLNPLGSIMAICIVIGLFIRKRS